ncbi:hypothetical protein GALMADRAFT_138290 [Galerina marginata CBS 339.88]|uniref:Uncharacterized protein n=1 Tax=Galerina marginata (strain CBS 339.88) TaxID=685588 RepID=A0A067T717_GALM3|nr:hypothetical protein GALMADRAFT_138290 [Galerina marginata CBS 339.88]
MQSTPPTSLHLASSSIASDLKFEATGTHLFHPIATFLNGNGTTPARSSITQISTTIPSPSDALVSPTSVQAIQAAASSRRTTLAISIGVSLGALAVVIVSLIFLRWRKRKRGRRTPPLYPFRPIPGNPLPGSMRPYITTQHSQTSDSALTLFTQPSSDSLSATSNTNSKARRWLPATAVTRLPSVVTPSERMHLIESITGIAFIAEGVPTPEYASNGANSTRSAGNERGAGGVGGVARVVSASGGSGKVVGVEPKGCSNLGGLVGGNGQYTERR